MTHLMKMTKRIAVAWAVALTLMLGGCSEKKQESDAPVFDPEVKEASASGEAAAASAEADPMSDKGIGPVTSVTVGAEVDQKLAEEGKAIFETKCSACHKMDTKYVGPALAGVTKRRSPEWIMNMIMNPVEMTQKDPIAKKLLEEHLTQMTFQDVKQEEARAILEYFRSLDAK